MKPEVILEIPCDNTEGSCYMTFNKIEEIDDVVETLEVLRAELEHQIEMEKQRKRDKRKRAKMRRKENKKEVTQIPVNLKNGDKFVVTCDDVIFDEENTSLDFVLNGKLVIKVPLSSLASEPDFE